MMKKFLLLGFLFAVAAPICTAETSGFAIDLVNPSRAYLLVDDAWKQNAECLQVKVTVTRAVTDPVLKAYFYGADGKLLHMEKKPSSQGDTERNQINPQTQFEKGKKYELFFGIPDAAAKWKRAIIVFGKPGDYATKIYPKDDLAKFDFPEKTSAAVAAQNATVPAPDLRKPIPEFDALKTPFDAQVKLEAEQTYTPGVKDLNLKYTAALDRAQEMAQQSGKLEEALAIKAEKEAIAAGKGVPATDDEKTSPVVKQLRSTYRVSISRLQVERVRKLQPLQAAFLRSLDALITSMTKEGKLDEAIWVKRERDGFAAAFAAPAPEVMGQLPAATTPNSAGANGAPLVNSLGMKFVAVPGTSILMCIHETRKGDYAEYAKANPKVGQDWKNPAVLGMPASTDDNHPVVEVSWRDSVEFCAWLSQKEGRTYRLPTDREWSFAVGLTKESKDETPESLSGKVRDEYPWGKKWPPPKGAGNYPDETMKQKFPERPSIVKYSDGFVTTAPVMSFEPNRLGIYDLGGNVVEYCQEATDASQKFHIIRGGSWDWESAESEACLSSTRKKASTKNTYRGFRCVVEVP